jgi:hypothetical protein
MKPVRTQPPTRRERQRGGITILVALVLLAVMALGAFSLSRNTLRDAVASGYTGQGLKAAEAADAGLDWFMVWGHPDNQPSATTAKRTDLVTKMANMQVYRTPHPVRTWDIAADITTTDSDIADDMAFDTAGASVKQNSAAGNETRQAFDLGIRFLGESEYGAAGATESSDPSGGKGTKKGTKDLRWQAVADGRASVSNGLLTYRSRREMITLQSPRQITIP